MFAGPDILRKCICHCAFLDTHHLVFLQDEESIPMELRNLPEYKELLQLKRLKKKTLQDIREDKIRVQHIGYKVKYCVICRKAYCQ